MILERISSYLNLDAKTILEGINRLKYRYKIYTIPKKSGGRRVIYHPPKELKLLQYCMIDLLFDNRDLFPISEYAYGYVKGLKSPLKKNAEKHAGFKYTVHLDILDFFPSIVFHDLILLIKSKGIDLTKKDEKVIRDICFYYNKHKRVHHLIIGAPSSPLISNILMYELDLKIAKEIKKIAPDSIYTRYADDIAISTNERNIYKTISKKIDEILKSNIYPKLKLNYSKTKFTSQKVQRKISGLTITPEKSVTIGREKTRKIRSMIFKYKNKSLEKDDILYLQGMLAFVFDNDPLLLDRLTIKYSAETIQEILSTCKDEI